MDVDNHTLLKKITVNSKIWIVNPCDGHKLIRTYLNIPKRNDLSLSLSSMIIDLIHKRRSDLET